LVLNELESKPVVFSRSVSRLFTEWSHNLNQRAEELSERFNDIGGYISRLNVYGLKFALIYQQLDDPTQSITDANMEAGIATAEWLLNHLIYMLDKNYIFNRFYADRLKIRGLIKNQPSQQISRTDLMNLSNFDKKQLDRTLASEIDAGKIKKDETDTGGVRPRVEYTLARAEAT
jgi:hypothetical protein